MELPKTVKSHDHKIGQMTFCIRLLIGLLSIDVSSVAHLSETHQSETSKHVLEIKQI